MDLTQRLRRITRKLADIPEMPDRVKPTGEEDHRFQLGPPLTVEHVARFERHHGIVLPGDYRAFITQVGNGGPCRHHGCGAGPPYGLRPLPPIWAGDAGDDDRSLARPFPAVPGRVYPEDLPWGCGEWLDGTIVLGDQGCAVMSLLVVTGAGRGRVAYATADVRGPKYTLDRDFLAWYERWLDETAAGMEPSWADCHVDEACLQDAEWLLGNLRQEPNPYDRAGAALALGAHLATPRVRAALHAAVGDAHDDVRVAALTVLGKHPAVQDAPVVRAALQDVSPRVRTAASWALSDA